MKKRPLYGGVHYREVSTMGGFTVYIYSLPVVKYSEKKGACQNLFLGSAIGYTTEPSKKVLSGRWFCGKLTKPFIILYQKNGSVWHIRYHIQMVLHNRFVLCSKSIYTSADAESSKTIAILNKYVLLRSLKEFQSQSKYKEKY